MDRTSAKMHDFVLNLLDLGEGGRDYAFPVEPEWTERALGGSELRVDPDAGAGSLEVQAQRSGDDVLVQGQLHTRVLATCSRCLRAAPIDVRSPIHSLLTPRAAATGAQATVDGQEIVVDPEDVDRDFYSGEEIVLDEIVRQHILLECPMQPLCADDCPGIDVPEHVRPPEDPVDPRLAPLMKLADKLPHNEE